jgi:hypothetical protein
LVYTHLTIKFVEWGKDCIFAFVNKNMKVMLQTQVLEDTQGTPMGVFIPMQVWETIKIQYPDIENCDNPLPQWEKDFIEMRLDAINQNPNRLQPIEMLFQNL